VAAPSLAPPQATAPEHVAHATTAAPRAHAARRRPIPALLGPCETFTHDQCPANRGQIRQRDPKRGLENALLTTRTQKPQVRFVPAVYSPHASLAIADLHTSRGNRMSRLIVYAAGAVSSR